MARGGARRLMKTASEPKELTQVQQRMLIKIDEMFCDLAERGPASDQSFRSLMENFWSTANAQRVASLLSQIFGKDLASCEADLTSAVTMDAFPPTQEVFKVSLLCFNLAESSFWKGTPQCCKVKDVAKSIISYRLRSVGNPGSLVQYVFKFLFCCCPIPPQLQLRLAPTTSTTTAPTKVLSI
jgi:hypothetical protein